MSRDSRWRCVDGAFAFGIRCGRAGLGGRSGHSGLRYRWCVAVGGFGQLRSFGWSGQSQFLLLMGKEAVDDVELQLFLGFAFELAFEHVVFVDVEGEYLLEGLGSLDLTGDVAVGLPGRELSELPEAVDHVGAGEGKGAGEMFAGFLEQCFLFFWSAFTTSGSFMSL